MRHFATQSTTKRGATISRVLGKAMRKEIADNTQKLEEIAAMRDELFKLLHHFVSRQESQFEQFKQLVECSQRELRELRKTVNEKLKAIRRKTPSKWRDWAKR